MDESRNSQTVRRMKSYTGATGYVYQYYFVGKRGALESSDQAPATEFIFDVTPDRKTLYAVSVFLRAEALAEWSRQHGRVLSETEQYAAAKLRLFRAFDEIEDLRKHLPLVVDGGNIEEVLSPLGLDQ